MGHFPERAVMPGVLIVEAMAQTAGALVMHSLGAEASAVVYFMSIENARFRKPVSPGELLRMEVKLIFEALADLVPDINLASEPQRLRSGWLNAIKEMQVNYK